MFSLTSELLQKHAFSCLFPLIYLLPGRLGNAVMLRDMVSLQAPVPIWATDPYESTQVPASKEMEGGKSRRDVHKSVIYNSCKLISSV